MSELRDQLLDGWTWSALTTVHASLAEGDGLAKRYPAAIGPLAGVREQSEEAYRALARVLRESPPGILFLTEPPRIPAGWRVVREWMLEQRVLTGDLPADDGFPIEKLSERDAGEMVALAALAEPGPFRERTIELGGYVGIRDPASGRLVAMAGQRTALTGFREVSAVCTHPEYRGRGYGGALTAHVAREIAARGETPFLGVRVDNQSARRVYERIGFALRRTFYGVVVIPPE
jgi:ribosomal protein S18 acetylase RimI-like enzyme